MNRKFNVQSKSDERVYYTIQEARGDLECDCPAGSREKNCNHKDIVRKFLGRQPLKLEDLKRIKEI